MIDVFYLAKLFSRKCMECFNKCLHNDDIFKWEHFLRFWSFVRGIHWSPRNSPSQWPVTRSFDVLFDLRLHKLAGEQAIDTQHDLRRHSADNGVTVIPCAFRYSGIWKFSPRTNYGDVIMDAMASQITSLTTVYSTVDSGAHQRKYQSSASLAFVRGIHRWPVNSLHKWPVTQKMFPFPDDIMKQSNTMESFAGSYQWGRSYSQLNILRHEKSIIMAIRYVYRTFMAFNINTTQKIYKKSHIATIRGSIHLTSRRWKKKRTAILSLGPNSNACTLLWITRTALNSLHKAQWRGPLMFSLICAWINGWVNNREAGNLRRHCAHYDVTVMAWWRIGNENCQFNPRTCNKLCHIHISGKNITVTSQWAWWRLESPASRLFAQVLVQAQI